MTQVTKGLIARDSSSRASFLEDFRSFMEVTVPVDRCSFQWFDPRHDPVQFSSLGANKDRIAAYLGEAMQA